LKAFWPQFCQNAGIIPSNFFVHFRVMGHNADMPFQGESHASSESLRMLYVADETTLVSALAASSCLSPEQRSNVGTRAAAWVQNVRQETRRMGVIDAFLQQYGLSTNEGVILMRLSEALIRTPDFGTAQLLMRDKLRSGDWADHAGASPAGLINVATAGLRFSAAWIEATGGGDAIRLAAKLGDRVLHTAVVRGMEIMAGHFVLGSTIADAVARSQSEKGKGALYSFDMLGEAALTHADADHYFKAYRHAVRHLAKNAKPNSTAATADGISVKLSALYPRYEYAKRAACVPSLVEKLVELAEIARNAGIGLTIDAEEADRLELSIEIFDALLKSPGFSGWDGLGLVIQAYQRRAGAVIDIVSDSAKAAKRQIAVRLVKGAYWDAEIKRAQELGLESYPVFTRKEHTDISYLACAERLISAGAHIYPQFATHNAHTVATILEMTGSERPFEFQRLHGMGEALHDQVCAETGIATRVYAPVGNHRELLPYLVRRLLENGANSSFVNQLINPEIAVDDIVRDPVSLGQAHGFGPHPEIPNPCDMFGGERLSAHGIDLTQSAMALQVKQSIPVKAEYDAASLIGGLAIDGKQCPIYNPASLRVRVGTASLATRDDVQRAVGIACKSDWATKFNLAQRADCLNRIADILETRMLHLLPYLVLEAGKCFADAVAEVREAVDFCRYYAVQALTPRFEGRLPLGVVACISPWNFPLAIFLGQVTAALAAGNSVVAKPAGQTPLIAFAAVKIAHEAGVPEDALNLVIGDGDVGAALISQTGVDAVCFTGSTATAKKIAAVRAEIGMADSVLIAETGGINTMIVDSTALLEQAVSDVIASAFQSAGQRCSACRLVCVQDDIADDFEKMLAGAMACLVVGNPAFLSTDVGPIIDRHARSRIDGYIASSRKRYRVIGEAPDAAQSDDGHFVRPIAFSITDISDLKEEVFGPVLHVTRFGANDLHIVVDKINALGFGLTMGLHTRIDSRISAVSKQAKVGNLYVNRNQIGAVVGVQPFGGEGLSGTGPKAGGPHYLLRLSRPAPASIEQNNPHERDFAALMGHYAELLAILQKTQILPGPTGEKNSLSLVPRGEILLAGPPKFLAAQIAICLATGNQPTTSEDLFSEAAIIDPSIESAKNQTNIFRESLQSLLDRKFPAIIADAHLKKELAALYSKRADGISTLLSSEDDMERFMHERTLTIDTTAAGGNATLLAMQPSG
jgi:RHH-type transcriptional regulator, proline utilization regulon repressor / proline dehydrogenase / delta 1-pyrroline-5-carboxylate dehydrogenase